MTGISYSVQDVLLEARRWLQFCNQANLPDSTLLYYLNIEWTINVPQSFTHFGLKTINTFMTTKGQPVYPFPIGVELNFDGLVYCDGLPINLQQDPNQFQNVYGNMRSNYTPIYGNGTIGAYTCALQSFPMLPGYTDALGLLHPNVILTTTSTTGTELEVYDNGIGSMIGNGSGTVNYQTGVISNLIFSLPVLDGAPIYANNSYYAQGRPYAVLFYQNAFSFRPVPDRPYCIQYDCYAIPQPFTETTTTLPLPSYFTLLAQGTALQVAHMIGDQSQVLKIKSAYDQSKIYIQNITTRQRANLRPSTQFFNPSGYGYTNQAWANNPAPYS